MTALALLGTRRSFRVLERNARSYLRTWPAFLSGFLEPILYLFSIGIGVGALVGDLPGPGGEPIPYDVFVAPAMLATAGMNATIFDCTIVFFYKYKYAHTFEGMLATPLTVRDVVLGELLWALMRGAIYCLAFLLTMVAMGLVLSWWAVLAVPAAVLIAYAFGGAGLGLTTYMRSFVDFPYITLAIAPLALFSATFFPLAQYPDALGWIVRASPLYQGVAIERALVLGDVDATIVLHAAYLVLMGWAGLRLATRRLGLLLLP
ncbi:MAG TPA: ABC transporter permease [Acidimicrobiales bacterium]